MYFYEKIYWKKGKANIMGVDEVGRGGLSGPVAASGVILPPNCHIKNLKDSKQLSPIQRQRFMVEIKKKLFFGLFVL